MGGAARPHRVSALRGDGRTAVTARCARRRALCGRAARYLAALSRLVEPAHHRRSENAAIWHSDALGRAREHLRKTRQNSASHCSSFFNISPLAIQKALCYIVQEIEKHLVFTKIDRRFLHNETSRFICSRRAVRHRRSQDPFQQGCQKGLLSHHRRGAACQGLRDAGRHERP